MVDKVELRQVFSEYFGFPCQYSFHQFLHNHLHLSSGASTVGQWADAIGQLVADIPSGLKSHPTPRGRKGAYDTNAALISE
jgi:hypothetical protein